ncbi:hypothetical protein GQ53DRAFT_328931 [Thozetella sp. PMI_491]|nr:hypothetical protein GQ53DRAFT_328931 [Thozetella sp. PMI_491]
MRVYKGLHAFTLLTTPGVDCPRAAVSFLYSTPMTTNYFNSLANSHWLEPAFTSGSQLHKAECLRFTYTMLGRV